MRPPAGIGFGLDQGLLELQRGVRVSGNLTLDSVRSVRSQEFPTSFCNWSGRIMELRAGGQQRHGMLGVGA